MIEDVKITEPFTVTFLGAKSHGKTALINKIIDMADSGGIVMDNESVLTSFIEKDQVKMMLVDIPGDEEFDKVRGKSIAQTDIIVVVFSSVNSIPAELIDWIEDAWIQNKPIIPCISKVDMENSDADAALDHIMEDDFIPISFDYTNATFKVSAVTGEGIDNLVEQIIYNQQRALYDLANPYVPEKKEYDCPQCENGYLEEVPRSFGVSYGKRCPNCNYELVKYNR